MIVARIIGMLEPAVNMKRIAKGIEKSAAYFLSSPLSLMKKGNPQEHSGYKKEKGGNDADIRS